MNEKRKLEVGDEVFLVSHGFGGRKISRCTVTRVTPTQAIISTAHTQWRAKREICDGESPRDTSSWPPRIYFPTEALRDEYRHQNLVDATTRLCSPENLKLYSDEILMAIIVAIKSISGEKESDDQV